MSSSMPDPLFQDWAEDRELQRLESEIENAGDVERNELSSLERFEEEQQGHRNQNAQLLKSVADYAHQGILETLGAGALSPANSLAAIVKADLETTDGPIEPASHRRSSIGKPIGHVEEIVSSKPRSDSSVGGLWRHIVSLLTLTREQKILVRNAVILSAALVFPFFEQVRDLASGTGLLIPIYALILALRPLNDTCLGIEGQQFMSFVLMWPFVVAYAIFMVAVTAQNLTGFMILFGIGVLLIFLVGLTYPTCMLAILLQTITFSVQSLSVWKVYNLEPAARPFHEALLILGGATFGMAIPFCLHMFGALVIFPWSSIQSTHQILSNRYTTYGTLLRRLRPIFAKVAVETLDPSSESGEGDLDPELLRKLTEARQAEISSILLVQKWMGLTLLETRFHGRGDGLRYLERYDQGLTISRIAGAAADDLLNHQEERRNIGPAARKVDQAREKARFLEQEAQAEIETDVAEINQRRLERKRIPVLLYEINLLLELGAHRLSSLAGLPPSPKDAETQTKRTNTLALLEREQEALSRLATELEELMVTWMRRYLQTTALRTLASMERKNREACFHRTTLTSYVLELLRLVRAQEEAWTSLREETSRQREDDWRHEWSLTFPFQDDFLASYYSTTRAHFYVKDTRFRSRFENAYASFFTSGRWKMAFKFALGTSLLTLPGLLDPSYLLFSSVQLLNAVFAFQVILFKTQTGLVIERTAHRLLGVTLGYVVAGVIWELACIGSCAAIHQWIFYAAEIVALAFYLWAKAAYPQYGYVVFAAFRTIVSLAVVFSSSETPSTITVWREGGFILVSTLIGAAGALLLALFLWPTSGRSLIRATLSQSFHDFVLLFEQVLTERYEHPDTSEVLPQVAAFEHQIASTLHVDIALQLRSAQLESMQRLAFDVPHEDYVKAVQSTRRVWHSLWKLHHLGGVRMQALLQPQPQHGADLGLQPETARLFFSMHRWLTSAFSTAAARLGSQQKDSMPVLRPVAATPHLLREMLQDFLTRAFRDEAFYNCVLASQDLGFMANMLFMADSMQDISYALDDVFTFIEHFLQKPMYADRLRAAEQARFDVFASPSLEIHVE
ncbi:Hypothetical Protein FCC1311_032622 [Hondaea fermentalgiana]|uniref:DUF2421 domain-containing protein n=1 Tax=Hondaea fermentalgiana TaxID=2315210 RepID=A0A2R5G9P9_9STRA|nr:Hypothetical Protein FCC1311_032622 [Hondaea fermentalgiana]|eukprot:GBG27039.1 Hypothetical Protein FCC1311_032622 [Hondaea fermentalgiana]